MRVFRQDFAIWSEIAEPDLASVTWRDTLDQAPSCQVVTVDDETPPDRLLIVPSLRQDIEVPYYGPYDVATNQVLNPTGSQFNGIQAHDFARIFASGDSAPLLGEIEDQIKAYVSRGYPPFALWASAPSSTDAGFVARLGDSFAALAKTTVINATGLEAVEAALAQFGLNAHLQVDWSQLAGFSEKLTLWPRHPIVITAINDAGLSIPTYGALPVVGRVTDWDAGLPVSFRANEALSPVIDLPEGAYCDWEYRPTVNGPDLFNAPVHYPGLHPNYRTRRINVGHRLLGAQDVNYFHTGTVGPDIYLSTSIGPTGNAKFGEEMRRWDLQNSSAKIAARRGVVDAWTRVGEVALAPLQIVTFPADLLSRRWPEESRSFVLRNIQHSWTAESGYVQQVEGTLWQGPFESLRAIQA